jgi:hypothetical protein
MPAIFSGVAGEELCTMNAARVHRYGLWLTSDKWLGVLRLLLHVHHAYHAKLDSFGSPTEAGTLYGLRNTFALFGLHIVWNNSLPYL